MSGNTPIILDMNEFETKLPYLTATTRIYLADVVLNLKPTIESWMAEGELEVTESFGFALAPPDADWRSFWDDPYRLGALIVHWGPGGPGCAANALRKMRAAARLRAATYILNRLAPDLFEDVVKSEEPDGSFAWGDDKEGGATYLKRMETGRLHLLGAVSGFTPKQNHDLATIILGKIARAMSVADHGA